VLKNWKIIFFIFLLMLYCCDTKDCNPFGAESNGPVEPKLVDVEVKYQRVDDDPNCPILFPPALYPWHNSVYLAGLKGNKEMQKTNNNNIHVTIVNDLAVGYPKDKYGGESYTVYVLDNSFYDFYNSTGCDIRAHKLWLNGYLMQKIYHRHGGEYLYVSFDENGIPHE